ncbi:hypothetical protein A9K71_17235 [Mesorhizobium sp. WSM3873]|nr:hypothetical protein A9K71_17235 [Mesorhizobium sp. WSM3873]
MTAAVLVARTAIHRCAATRSKGAVIATEISAIVRLQEKMVRCRLARYEAEGIAGLPGAPLAV